jgi:hypothetical protein
LMVTPFDPEDGLDAKCPASPPTRAATNKSEIRVDQGARLERTCEESGAGSGASAAGASTGEGCSKMGGVVGGESFGSVGPVVTTPC